MAAPTKMQKALNEAEAVINAKSDEVMEELNLITSTLPALKQAVEDANDEVGPVSEIWTRIRNGEDVPAADLVTAEAQEKINARRLSYLTGRKSALKRSLPVDTLVLAERTAKVLREVMQGFDVYVTRAPASTWTFPESTTAIVVVAESGIEREPYTGLVSGKVTVLMHRPGLYRPINVDAFERIAKAERLSLTVQSNRVGDEGGYESIGGIPVEKDPNTFVIDTLAVRLDNVIDEYAVIPQIDLSGLNTRSWVEEVFRSNGSHPNGLPGTDKPWEWGVAIGQHLVATGHAAEIVSEDIDDNGVRTLVVKVAVNTMSTNPIDFREGLDEAMRLDNGFAHKGLGVLTGSEVKMASTVAERQTANWTVLLTFESKAA